MGIQDKIFNVRSVLEERADHTDVADFDELIEYLADLETKYQEQKTALDALRAGLDVWRWLAKL